jgi:hypothetical protein
VGGAGAAGAGAEVGGAEVGGGEGGVAVGVAVGVADTVGVIVGEPSVTGLLADAGDVAVLTRGLLELLPVRAMPPIAAGATTAYRVKTSAKATAELALDNPGTRFQPAQERRPG